MDGLTPAKFLLIDRPAWVAVSLAFAIGAAYAWYLFGTDFVLGSADYWRRPRGYMGGRLDMASVLSAYHWFVADDWRWPLLSIPRASWPEGANAFALDVAPLVALIGKLIRTLTGWHINLYPAWHVLTFALPAALLTALVRALGQRSLAAALLGGAMGALAPMVHLRFGHAAQLAHWLPIAALALYFSAARWRLIGLLGVALLAACVNLYLFVMVAAVASAAFLQAWADGRISLARFAGLAVALPLAGFLPVWSFGLLNMPNLTTGEIQFGAFSMNVGSLFWPQTSGALQWTGIPALTGEALDGGLSQYEGYAYLGLGALLLLATAALLNFRRILPCVRRHWALALVMLVLGFWALSNEVYVGSYLLVKYPLPQFLLDTVLAWFRSSGRFIWPLAWLLMALGIAGTLARARPRVALVLLVVAIGLQWADLSIWRARIGALVAAAQPSAFGDEAAAARLEQEIATRGLVTIIPPFFCSSSGGDYEGAFNVAASETQLMAGRNNARMRWTLTARGKPDCAAAASTDLRTLAADGVLIVLADKEISDRTNEARARLTCRDFALGVICTAPNNRS